jgi:hypothetical protein
MKLRLILILLIVSPVASFAQYTAAWTLIANGTSDSIEFSESLYPKVLTCSDSGFVYSACNTMVGNQQDILLVKLDQNGQLIWSYEFDNGGQTVDMVTSIGVDRNGDLLVLGNKKNSSTDWDIELIKISTTGSLIWVYTFTSVSGGGIDLASEVICDVDSNNILVCGISSAATYSYAVIKIDNGGFFIDSTLFNGGTGNYGYPNHIEIDSVGGVYMTGQYKNTTDNSDDGLLVKYDANLNVNWFRTYGGVNGGGDYYYDMTLDGLGNIIVVGAESQGTVNQKFLAIKYDTSGSILWNDNYSSQYYQNGVFRCVTADENGNIYAVGECDSSGVTNMATIRYSSQGVVDWLRSFCGIGMLSATANSIDYKSGQILCTGYSVNPTRGLISIYDTIGNVVWLHESSLSGGDQGYYSGVLDSMGNVFVMGNVNTPLSSYQDLLVQKFVPDLLSVGEELSRWFIYPNPTTYKIHLSSPIAQYSVYDVNGELVKSDKGSSFSEIDLSSLPSGVYFLQTDNSSRCLRLIKM